MKEELAGNILDVLLREKGEPRITAQEVVWAVEARFAEADCSVGIDLRFEHCEYSFWDGCECMPSRVDITNVEREDFIREEFHKRIEILLQRGFTRLVGHGS